LRRFEAFSMLDLLKADQTGAMRCAYCALRVTDPAQD
jgi:hypothetical protein